MQKISIKSGVTAMALPIFLLVGCTAPSGPVEVTRFHAENARAALGKGNIALYPDMMIDPQSLEYKSYYGAVARELSAQGYQVIAPANGGTIQRAIIGFQRFTGEAPPRNNPVSVGVGGNVGSYGSGVGVGIGIDLSGPEKPKVKSMLSVFIEDRNGQRLWEGRAEMQAKQGSPMAETGLAADKLSTSLFQGFPGGNGETITVK